MDEIRVYATKKRMDNDTEYFETEDDPDETAKIPDNRRDEEQGNFE